MPTIREFVEEATNSGSTSRLEELAAHRSTSVRIAVAENTSSADGLILRLSRDADELVRLSAAGNVRNRPHIHDSLAHSDDKWVRAILAHTFARDDDRSLSYAVQRQLAFDDFWEVRERIAETTNYSDLFDSCLADVHPA
jgi:hypothetical protein